MTYPDPTTEQMIIIAAAAIAPLVWAFTHHGTARKVALVFWMPFFLFVTRTVYMNRIPTAPLESRLERAFVDMSMDPMTILWPAFVLSTFSVIRFFATRRQRREASARAAAHPLAQREREQSSAPGPKKRCLGCNRRVVVSAASCPYCGYSFSPDRIQQPKISALSTSPPVPPRPHPQPEPLHSVNVADAAVPERIRMLGALRDDGLLTEEEFQAKKTALLAAWPHPVSSAYPSTVQEHEAAMPANFGTAANRAQQEPLRSPSPQPTWKSAEPLPAERPRRGLSWWVIGVFVVAVIVWWFFFRP